MSSDSHRPGAELPGWIEAEMAGRLDEADAAFARIFAASTERLAPPARFADLVVERALRAREPSAAWLGVPVRLLIGLAMVLMGLPIAFISGAGLFELLAGPGPRLASAFARFVGLVGGAASAAGAAWSVASAVGEAVLQACATGPVPLILLLNVLLAVAGYVGLRRLLAPAKECW
ncbi:MAG TPA: hypothetical protein PKK95_11790 [Vicinamibacterales bacterium]|nr:hypothetical protein [Vicinamibacterales bacterium]